MLAGQDGQPKDNFSVTTNALMVIKNLRTPIRVVMPKLSRGGGE
jgi:hypothetical protein